MALYKRANDDYSANKSGNEINFGIIILLYII